MKIYIVESGEYSDRIIEGVFSTREKAEEYIKYHRYDSWYGDTFRITEYDLDSWNKDDYIYEHVCNIDDNGELDFDGFRTIEHKLSEDINMNSRIFCGRFRCFSRNMLDIKEISDKYQKFRAEEIGL
jgi:hypothetical protein